LAAFYAKRTLLINRVINGLRRGDSLLASALAVHYRSPHSS
jgi:hypothetical protein